MREKVVCNASPLIFLAKIGRLDLLESYNLFIPSQVEAEILAGLKKKRGDAKRIVDYLETKKITPVKVIALRNLPLSLGAGERAVISLAVKENIKRVFIDEAKARTVARFNGLEPKGTIGIVWDSYKTGKIDKLIVEALLFDLIEKGYRIREEIFIEFLKKVKGL